MSDGPKLSDARSVPPRAVPNEEAEAKRIRLAGWTEWEMSPMRISQENGDGLDLAPDIAGESRDLGARWRTS